MSKSLTKGDILRDARKAKGLTQEALGNALDPPIGKQGIYKLEKGIHRISARLAEQLSKLLDISALEIVDSENVVFLPHPEAFSRAANIHSVASLPVKCVAKAGYWAEPEMLQDAQDNDEYGHFVSIPPRPGYDVESQYAVRLDGNSINKIAPSGAYAICIRYDAWPSGDDIAKLNGCYLHVERTRGGLVENTIKQLRMDGGQPKLWPNSNDPRHQEPVPLGAEDDDTVAILGIVIGTYAEMPLPC